MPAPVKLRHAAMREIERESLKSGVELVLNGAWAGGDNGIIYFENRKRHYEKWKPHDEQRVVSDP
jgi:hypothetical protein